VEKTRAWFLYFQNLSFPIGSSDQCTPESCNVTLYFGGLMKNDSSRCLTGSGAKGYLELEPWDSNVLCYGYKCEVYLFRVILFKHF